MLNLKKFAAAIVLMVIISTLSFVNNMDMKISEREQAWAETVQAIEAEQEKVNNEIMMLKDQLKIMGKEVGAQSVLIWDIRNRVNLDLEWEIEQEGY